MNVRTGHAEAGLGAEPWLAHNRYFDRTFGLEAVKVLPGECYVTGSNMVLVTMLGSCVSACLWDPELGVGGLNHFMLPHAGEPARDAASSARYGGYAMELLINRLQKLGARRDRLEAKVFGGGAVMASLAGSAVGERNAAFVLEYLSTEAIPVRASDLLDVHPRKIYFFPRSGRVLVRRILRLHNDTLARRESEYAERLHRALPGGEVELFD